MNEKKIPWKYTEEVVRGEEKGEENEGGGKEGEDLGEGKYCLQHLRLCNICKLLFDDSRPLLSCTD